MYEDALMRAIENHINEPVIISLEEEGSYQGEMRILAYSRMNDMYAEGSISWGSCSYCDPWYDMSIEEMANELTKDIVTFTPDAVRTYLKNIVATSRNTYYDNMDHRWAKKALEKIGA